MKRTFFLLCAGLPLFLLSAAPEEEQYGARIYFMQDAFEQGNYRDYFQKAFAGSLVRNCEGRKGTFAKVTYGDSRPFRVTPGKRYRLSFDVFNLGAKDLKNHNPAGGKAPFPFSFQFLDDSWGVVRSVKGKDIPGATLSEPPPAAWCARSFVFDAPPKAAMFTFHIVSAWKNNWGPYLIANVELTEIKEK